MMVYREKKPSERDGLLENEKEKIRKVTNVPLLFVYCGRTCPNIDTPCSNVRAWLIRVPYADFGSVVAVK